MESNNINRTTQVGTDKTASETMSAKFALAVYHTGFGRKVVGMSEVLRALVSHREWLVPLEMFAREGESKRRIEKMLVLGSERIAPADELWIFTDEEAALEAHAKHPLLGTYGGGMSGTELFGKIPPNVKLVSINPGSPEKYSWYFQTGGGIEAARMWAKAIALEDRFAEWEQIGAFDEQAFDEFPCITFNRVSGGVLLLPYESGTVSRAAVFTAPDCVEKFLSRFSESQRAQLTEATVEGAAMLKQLLELGADGIVFNIFGPGATFVHDFVKKPAHQTVQTALPSNGETHVSTPALNDSEKAEEFFNFGWENFNSGNYQVALLDFSCAIQINPDFIEAYHNRGLCFHSLGNFDKAIKDFDKVLDSNPKNFEVLHFRGKARSRRRDYEIAIADLTKAAELNAENADVFYQRGVAYVSLAGSQNYDNAIRDFDRAIALAPDFHHGYTYRGLCYYEKGDDDKAIQDCNEAIKRSNDNIFAYLNRAKAFTRKRDFDKALKDFDKSVELLPNELLPNEASVYYDRGTCYYEQGKYEQAVTDFTESIRLGYSGLYIAYNNRAVSFRDWGFHDKALEDFSRSIELNPSFFDAYLNRGAIYSEQKNDYARAIKDFSKAIELNPHSIQALQNRAIVYERNGLTAEAEADEREINEMRNFLRHTQLYGLVDYAELKMEETRADFEEEHYGFEEEHYGNE